MSANPTLLAGRAAVAAVATAVMLAIAAPRAASQQTWTYSDCVDYALEHNITLQKSRLTEQTGVENLDEARAQWQPTLDFATSQGFTNTPWAPAGADRNSYSGSYGLSAGWTVWNGGERENTIRRNELQTRIDRLNTGETMRSLRTDLLQVYINLLYAKESIGIYDRAAELSLAQAERAKALMEAGRISRVDYAQLQSQYEQDRYALVNARGLYDTRRMELKKLLELGIDTDIEPADIDWDEDQVTASLPPIEESFDLAVATDLRLQSLALSEEGASIDIDIARAAGRPRLSLNAAVATGSFAPGASFGTTLRQRFNETVGLTLAVPILDNRRARTAVAKARIQQLDAQLDLDLRRTELAQAVENWYIDTRSAQARYTAAAVQLRAATLTSDLTSEQFSLGLVNPVELMSAHNALVEAQHTLLQAKCMAMLGQKMIEFYRTAAVTL